MEYSVTDFLNLLGSLGVFIFGMKLISESIQKIFGDRIINLLSTISKSKILGLFTGILIAASIQSSTATTIMVANFASSSLFSLTESICVIIGANIGTTATAWIVSVLGFKIRMSLFALPLVGIGLPFLFSKNRYKKSCGELIMGFSLFFIGLKFLNEVIPDANTNNEFLTFITQISTIGCSSYLLFIVIGAFLTIILKSSSASMVITFTLCQKGLLPFELAASMVLGENIGTAVSTNIATLTANAYAKRVALAHLIFNIFGVVWALSFFSAFIEFISQISISLGWGNPNINTTAMPLALSIFHTAFNVVNASILIWLVNHTATMVTKLIPTKKDVDNIFKIKHINTGILSTPDASIYQVKRELTQYARNNVMMFNIAICSIKENKKDFYKTFKQLQKLEDDSDNNEIIIANYLTKISETKLSTINSKRISAMFKIVSDMESIADSILNIVKSIERGYQQKLILPKELIEKLDIMFVMIKDSLETMVNNTEIGYEKIENKKAYELENKINTYRDYLRKEQISHMEQNTYNYPIGVIYSEIFSECEQIGDYAIKVTQAINEIKSE